MQRGIRGDGDKLIPAKLSKAVIPVAGLGTRFLPFTKSVPKALLPILDTPVIELIVKEAIEAGLREIIIVLSPGQDLVEKYFKADPKLENHLHNKGAIDLMAQLTPYYKEANIQYVCQTEPLGLGNAVLTAEPLVGMEPFALLLGDDLFLGTPSPSKELSKVFEQKQQSVVALLKVPSDQVVHYGVVDVIDDGNGVYTVKNVIEKPSPQNAPSSLILPGRYLLTPDIFKFLREIKPSKSGEYQLTDALNLIAKSSKLYALEVTAKRFDVGQVMGFLSATLSYAWNRKELRATIQEWLSENIKK